MKYLEKFRSSESAGTILGLISIIGALMGIVSALFLIPFPDRVDSVFSKISGIQDRIDRVSSDYSRVLDLTKEQITELKSIIEKAKEFPPDSDMRLLISSYDSQIGALKKGLSRIEEVILQDANKSVSIIILKKDLDFLQKSFDDKLAVANSNIERLYSILGWSFGGLFIAIIAQVASGFISRRSFSIKADEDKKLNEGKS
jgi:hypothetical protein